MLHTLVSRNSGPLKTIPKLFMLTYTLTNYTLRVHVYMKNKLYNKICLK